MILQCYSIYDKAISAFSRPFYAVAKGEAVRNFMDACNDPAVPFQKHPGDFTLFSCGSFDDSSGTFVPEEPVRIISALECVAKPSS